MPTNKIKILSSALVSMAFGFVLVLFLPSPALAAGPDLTRRDPSINKTTAYPGDELILGVIVNNIGDASAGSSRIKFYWKKDSRSYTDTYMVDYSYVPTLPAGNSYPTSVRYTIPADASPGTYYLYYWVDANNDVVESNETNNKFYYTITVNEQPKPDLTRSYDNFSYDSPVEPGDSVVLNLTIKNIGSGDANSGSEVYYYLREGSASFSNSYKVGDDSFPALDVNETSSEIFSYQIPSDADPGTYYLSYWIDAPDNIDEGSNENNNKFQFAITVEEARKPDLIEYNSEIIPIGTVEPGEMINLDWEIKNDGPVSTDQGSYAYYYFQDYPNFNIEDKVGEDSFPILGPGQTSPEIFSYTVPLDTAPGNYYFSAWIDAPEDIDESNEIFNKVNWAYTVLDLNGPDLVADSIYPCDSNENRLTTVSTGETFYLCMDWHVEDMTVSEGFFSEMSILDGIDDETIIFSTEPGAVVGSYTMRSLSSFTYMDEISLDLIGQLDTENDVNEGNNEGNNFASFSFTVVDSDPPPDPEDDTDEDGFTDLEEIFAGTDPEDLNDLLPIYFTDWREYFSTLPDRRSKNETGDPVNSRTGGFDFTQTDFSLPGRGMGIDFSRVYNSRLSERSGRFGNGWSHSYNYFYYQDPSTKNVQIYLGGSLVSQFTTADGGATFNPPKGEYDNLFWRDGYLVYRTLSGIEYVFSKSLTDGLGIMEQIIDTNGNITSFSYTDVQNLPLLTSISDPVGRTVQFTYGDSGGDLWDKVVELRHTPAEGPARVVSYSYDANGNLIETEETRSYGQESDTIYHYYRYDANNRMVEYEDPRGTILYNNYDPQGRVIEQYEHNPRIDDPGDDRRIYIIAYTEEGSVNAPGSTACTVTLNFRDEVFSYGDTICFDSDQMKIYQAGGGGEEYWAYNTDGMVSSYTDPNGNVATYTYDSRRRLTEEVLPDINNWHTVNNYSYEDNFNRLTQKQEIAIHDSLDDETKTTVYTIDSNDGNLLAIQDPLGNSESFIYDSYGNITSHTDKNGNVTSYQYDADSNYLIQESITVQEADGSNQTATKQYTYDDFGNITQYITPRDHVYTYEYDSRGNLRKEINPDASSKTFIYDVEDHLISTANELGQVTNYTYDTDINASLLAVEQVSQSGNITSQKEYDYVGNLTKEIDPNGNATTYVYNTANRISQKITPYNTINYTYDDNGNLTKEVNSLEQRTDYLYDARNNLTEIRHYTSPFLYTTSLRQEYDGFGRMTREVDGNNNATTYTYDLNDNLVNQTDALSNEVSYIYDNNGNKTGELRPRAQLDIDLRNRFGQTISYEYDELNRLIKITNADDKDTLRFYDQNNNLVRIIDRQNQDGSANTHVQQYTYNNLDRLVTETDALGASINYLYDAAGNRTRKTDQIDRAWNYTYDDFNRLITETDPASNSTNYTYDDNGNRISITYADSTQTNYTYDSANRLTVITDALSNTREYTYDAVNNKLTETDKRGFTTSFTYDHLNRLTSETNPQSTVTNYTYDGNNNRLTETIDTKETSFTYDELNRVTEINHPGDNTESFSYDGEGNVVSETDGRNQTIDYTYDKLNRLTHKQIGAGLDDDDECVDYTYDNWGNPLSVIQTKKKKGICAPGSDMCIQVDYFLKDATEMTYQYDDNNRLTSESQQFHHTMGSYDGENYQTCTDYWQCSTGAGPVTITRTYQADGQLNTLTDAASRVLTYNYDNRGLLESVNYNSQALATYSYNAMGKPAVLSYQNGISNNYSYDSLNRLSVLDITDGVASLFKHEYSYDAESNRISLIETHSAGSGQDTNRTINYTYDNLGQITQVDYPDVNGFTNQINFTYDKWGNRTGVTTPYQIVAYTYAADSNELQSYSYNDGRLTVLNNYNANGSLTQEVYQRLGQNIRAVSYDWDKQNQLTTINYSSSDRPAFLPEIADNKLSFVYDDYGNRIKKVAGNYQNDQESATYYINDGLRVLNELDGQGNVNKSIVSGLEQIAEINDQGEITFVHSDTLGSTVLLTDEAGEVVQEYEYDVFGFIIGKDGSEETKYLFTGQEYDPESELYYYNARYYNPKIGRFISRDDLMGRDGDIISKNRYVYVKNNPLKYVDPTGEEERKANDDYPCNDPYATCAIQHLMKGISDWAYDNARSFGSYGELASSDGSVGGWVEGRIADFFVASIYEDIGRRFDGTLDPSERSIDEMFILPAGSSAGSVVRKARSSGIKSTIWKKIMEKGASSIDGGNVFRTERTKQLAGKADFLFKDKGEAWNWVKRQLGKEPQRLGKEKDRFLDPKVWKNVDDIKNLNEPIILQSQDGSFKVTRHYIDQKTAKGWNKFPHYNYKFADPAGGTVKGHLFIEDKIKSQGLWDEFMSGR